MTISIGTWYTATGTTKLVNGTTNKYETRIRYKCNSQSTSGNTSSVTVELQCRSVSSSYATYGYKQTSKIQGVSLSSKEFDMRDTNNWETFGSRTFNITHDDNGKKTVTLSASFSTTASSSYSLKSGSVSKSVELPTIARYAKITSFSISNSTLESLTVAWKTNTARDYTQYKLNGGSWTNAGDSGTTSGSFVISGLSPNTKYTVQIRVRRSDSGLWTESSTINGTTKDIARITSYSNFNLGDNLSVEYTNNSGENAAIGIFALDRETPYADYRNLADGTSYTFNFTDIELDSIYKAMKTNNSIEALLYINTKNNTYRESKQITITLTGNQKTIHKNINGNWKRGKVLLNVNGTWKRAVIWEKVNGVWKRSL